MNDFYKKFAYFYESEYGLSAREKITNLGIRDIFFYGNSVEIHLERPGLIIGPKCENINKLQEFVTPYKIHIVEVSNSPVYSILNCLNDRCLNCGELLMSPTVKFCCYTCRDENTKKS